MKSDASPLRSARTEEEESYYKMTIKREEGFSTPAESTPELTNGGGDMILAPTFAIMCVGFRELARPLLTVNRRSCTCCMVTLRI